MTRDQAAEQLARRSQQIVKQISPILHGEGPDVQSAALLDLLAMWLAGNLIFDDRTGAVDRTLTDALRDELLSTFLRHLPSIIAVNELRLLEGCGQQEQ